MRIEDLTRKIAEPFLEQHGCLLWDCVFEKEGAMWYLRILFDDKIDGKAAPLDMEKCEKLTLPLNKLIDEQEFMKKGDVDIVEIGSPGITRRLRTAQHFEWCSGRQVKVLRRLDNGKTESISGALTGYDPENKTITLTLNNAENTELIPLKKALRVNLEEQMQ